MMDTYPVPKGRKYAKNQYPSESGEGKPTYPYLPLLYNFNSSAMSSSCVNDSQSRLDFSRVLSFGAAPGSRAVDFNRLRASERRSLLARARFGAMPFNGVGEAAKLGAAEVLLGVLEVT
uniref:Uncharacterized protein n=1 Tax=Schistocephalus solidus TaxID=70667 RepID=A0A0X3NTR7_SCHSO